MRCMGEGETARFWRVPSTKEQPGGLPHAGYRCVGVKLALNTMRMATQRPYRMHATTPSLRTSSGHGFRCCVLLHHPHRLSPTPANGSAAARAPVGSLQRSEAKIRKCLPDRVPYLSGLNASTTVRPFADGAPAFASRLAQNRSELVSEQLLTVLA